jgi:hypothetical protein
MATQELFCWYGDKYTKLSYTTDNPLLKVSERFGNHHTAVYNVPKDLFYSHCATLTRHIPSDPVALMAYLAINDAAVPFCDLQPFLCTDEDSLHVKNMRAAILQFYTDSSFPPTHEFDYNEVNTILATLVKNIKITDMTNIYYSTPGRVHLVFAVR